jgi:hypothetical protein
MKGTLKKTYRHSVEEQMLQAESRMLLSKHHPAESVDNPCLYPPIQRERVSQLEPGHFNIVYVYCPFTNKKVIEAVTLRK